MSDTKKSTKKKFKMKDYNGYIALLIGLIILLFVLIGIAIHMIKDQYGVDVRRESVVETERMTEETETELIETKIEGTAKETTLETETEQEESMVNIEDPLLVLINKDHPIPDSMTYKLVQFEEEHSVDERMYNDLIRMISDAQKAGHELVVCSSWRSRELQTELYEKKIDEYLSYGYSTTESEELAAFWVAKPGTSEHEIGLAVDIVAKSYQYLDHDQANTNEQKWLMVHCQDYGFILRYPENKQDMTQIGYEPWHYRYVGKEAAKEIMNSGLCLEEYLGAVDGFLMSKK